MSTFDTLFKNHTKWVSKVFPKATSKGGLIHAEREIKEIIADIDNNAPIENKAEEYADVLGCIISSAYREGVTPKMLNQAFGMKLSKNKLRKWKDNGDGSYSHIKAV